ncbi:STAS domain-containing protein [Accumulibacter sp.]|uniref:STAS domain-containing protein n=1 Tax=Candidatus Accumulibacter proximus TaxID=2954385 RepID=A0A935Q0P4_9PROT|nr:STAS domain-containing protein [Accumulibacter sp.]MBK7676870.1 STAS domain-containing protein [Candidatus Accumulibacter proximus]MBL8375955.1 STAS domain-containing protein [Accumulibacter sp.]
MIEQGDASLRVTVPMVIANARTLLEVGRSFLPAGAQHELTLLDLSAVREIDSSALSVILAWLRTAGERGVVLRIVSPPASLISLATLYGLCELLPIA